MVFAVLVRGLYGCCSSCSVVSSSILSLDLSEKLCCGRTNVKSHCIIKMSNSVLFFGHPQVFRSPCFQSRQVSSFSNLAHVSSVLWNKEIFSCVLGDTAGRTFFSVPTCCELFLLILWDCAVLGFCRSFSIVEAEKMFLEYVWIVRFSKYISWFELRAVDCIQRWNHFLLADFRNSSCHPVTCFHDTSSKSWSWLGHKTTRRALPPFQAGDPFGHEGQICYDVLKQRKHLRRKQHSGFYWKHVNYN